VTGWRIASEVLPMEWRHVDFKACDVRLDPGTTKNREGRVFKMTTQLPKLLEEQRNERDRLKKLGKICPYVFFRMVADKRGGEKSPRKILSLNKAWAKACAAAGCPGRIPHDLRRTAIRNMVRAGIPERVAMKLRGRASYGCSYGASPLAPMLWLNCRRRIDPLAIRDCGGTFRHI
jgi:integrase